MKMFWFRRTTFHNNCHILLKKTLIHDFVGNLKLQVHPNICQETTVLFCMILGKKLHDKVFFIFYQKHFYPQNDGMEKKYI